MRPWITLLAVPMLLLAVAPSVSAGTFPSTCDPSSDASARSVDAGPEGVFYLRVVNVMSYTYVQVWHEVNGVPGLQPDATWNCGGPGDALVAQQCVSRVCPPTIY